MPLRVLVVSIALAAAGWRPLQPQTDASAERLALIGTWQLDLGRTHYGPGVDRRRSEQMRCAVHATTLSCTIESVRADGRRVAARFAAALAGGRAAVVGLADIDTVDLQPHADGLVDATFSYGSQPRYGYRAYRSADSNSLFIVSVDPITRAALTSIVVYRRAGTSSRAVSPKNRGGD